MSRSIATLPMYPPPPVTRTRMSPPMFGLAGEKSVPSRSTAVLMLHSSRFGMVPRHPPPNLPPGPRLDASPQGSTRGTEVMVSNEVLAHADPEVAAAIDKERRRQ